MGQDDFLITTFPKRLSRFRQHVVLTTTKYCHPNVKLITAKNKSIHVVSPTFWGQQA